MPVTDSTANAVDERHHFEESCAGIALSLGAKRALDLL